MILAGLILACGLVSGLTGCGGTSSRGVLRLPLVGALPLDPAFADTDAGAWGDTLLYSGLLKLDPSLHVVPDLAVALPTISPDGRRYEFTIRDDVRFADGRQLLASDFVYSFRRALSPGLRAAPARSVLGDIRGARPYEVGQARSLQGVAADGPHTLRIILNHPDAAFLSQLTLGPAAVLDPAAVRRGGAWWLRGAGTGPFRLARVGTPDVLAPNLRYYGGPIQVRRLELLPVLNSAQAYALFERHHADAAPVPLADFTTASKDPLFSAVDTLTAYYAVIGRIRPKGPRVALDQALNRSQLTSPQSPFDPLTTVVPATVPDYRPYSDPYQYSVVQASTVLAHVQPISLAAPSDTAGSILASWLRRSWQAAGARVYTSSTDPDVRVIRAMSELPDPGTWLVSFARAVPSRTGELGYLRLLADGENVLRYPDPLRRMAFYNQAEQYLLDRALVLPLTVLKQGYVIAARVHGLIATPVGLEPQSETWATVTSG